MASAVGIGNKNRFLGSGVFSLVVLKQESRDCIVGFSSKDC